ncbi:hypothetical protein FACS1894139_02420 [Planctomycetales bacterium]|nr:hypothetical protein FACS1894107_15540 [Planctomycetales bacterium]GHT01226.1 hypothetical protein FACS1894108_14700 [Planctomycetales bacterium]GHT03044.1 hypothetical protein FACS1894139_02420 [Planctomycetales bacterium]
METTTKPAKEFDCLKFKEEAQARVYRETKNMSTAELLRYFNREGKWHPQWWRPAAK